MNILIVAKLSDDKILTKLYPFVNNNKIDNIYILRDKELKIDIEKVTIITPKKYTNSLRHIEKIYLGCLAIKKYDIKLAISYLSSPHGMITYFISRLTGIKWIHSNIATKFDYSSTNNILRKIQIAMLKKADCIVAMGSNTKNFLINLGYKTEKVNIIKNGINCNNFTILENIENEYDIVYTGRIDENKNIELLVNSISKLSKVRPNIKVGIAGDGPSLSNISNMVINNGLQNNINIIGNIKPEEICEFLNKGKLYVFPSRSEGMPMSLIEAVCCGLVCVTTKVGEINDLIIDNESGMIIQDHDNPILLSKLLDELLNDEVKMKYLKNNAIEIVKNYNINKSVESWGSTIDSVMNKK